MDRRALENLAYLANVNYDDIEDGRCHVCLGYGLTDEHLPPAASGNSLNANWGILSDSQIPRTMSGFSKVRGGFRVESLCAKCNNGICSRYAQEYISFVRYLDESPRIFATDSRRQWISIPADTLLLAKQLATMILASEPLGYALHNPELRAFVLHPNRTYEPPFRVLAFRVPNRREAGTITRFHARADTFSKGYAFAGGEISYPPFGIVYTSQIGRGYDLSTFADITHWFRFGDEQDRHNQSISLGCRITGVDSIQTGLGRPRTMPQVDYVRPRKRRAK